MNAARKHPRLAGTLVAIGVAIMITTVVTLALHIRVSTAEPMSAQVPMPVTSKVFQRQPAIEREQQHRPSAFI